MITSTFELPVLKKCKQFDKVDITPVVNIETVRNLLEHAILSAYRKPYGRVLVNMVDLNTQQKYSMALQRLMMMLRLKRNLTFNEQVRSTSKDPSDLNMDNWRILVCDVDKEAHKKQGISAVCKHCKKSRYYIASHIKYYKRRLKKFGGKYYCCNDCAKKDGWVSPPGLQVRLRCNQSYINATITEVPYKLIIDKYIVLIEEIDIFNTRCEEQKRTTENE